MSIHPSLLSQFAFLKHLDGLSLERLATQSLLLQVAKREVVIDRGASSHAMFFLLEGRLQATDFTLDGKEVGLYFVEEGQYFGEIATFDGLNHSDMVIAIKKSQVIQIPNDLIRPQIFKDPHMCEAVTINLAERVRQLTQQRQILSINNPLQRVCSQLLLLLNYNDQLAKASDATQMVFDAPTHQELAIMANLSRETVTRSFQVLQSQGVLDRQAVGLVINVEKIKELAQVGES